MALVECRLALLGNFLLLRRMSEDDGAVLVALVAELAVAIEQIDVMPIIVDELVVAHDLRIVGDLNAFRVAGAAGRDLRIGWMPGGGP